MGWENPNRMDLERSAIKNHGDAYWLGIGCGPPGSVSGTSTWSVRVVVVKACRDSRGVEWRSGQEGVRSCRVIDKHCDRALGEKADSARGRESGGSAVYTKYGIRLTTASPR